jgi:hypothetical protein
MIWMMFRECAYQDFILYLIQVRPREGRNQLLLEVNFILHHHHHTRRPL